MGLGPETFLHRIARVFTRLGRPHRKAKACTIWLDSPLLHDYSCSCLWELGQPWSFYVNQKYALENKRCLSIGCGSGGLERGLVEYFAVNDIEAFDVDPASIAQAQALSRDAGYAINYFIADANTVILNREKYDIVFAHNSLHHVQNLEHIMSQVSQSLKPGGLFVVVEYVGPNRFGWTDKQLNLVNSVLELLPEKYRKRNGSAASLKPPVTRETMAWYLEFDPTEAIRSEDIIPVLARNFEILEQFNMGGTILHMLMHEIVGNFDESKDEDNLILRLLCLLEKSWIENGVIGSDEKFLICRKPLIK